MGMQMHICTYTCTHAHMHTYTCTHAHIHMHTNTDIQTHRHTDTQTHIHMRIHTPYASVRRRLSDLQHRLPTLERRRYRRLIRIRAGDLTRPPLSPHHPTSATSSPSRCHSNHYRHYDHHCNRLDRYHQRKYIICAHARACMPPHHGNCVGL